MTSTLPVPASTPTRGLDRRQLLKAGAWAAPAIVVAAAIPAAAASTTLALSAANLTLAPLCDGLKHGFTLTNNSSLTGTVTLSFSAQAWALTKPTAANNVTSVTTASTGATYGSAVSGYTYKTVWADAITYSASSGGGGWNAKRSGTAVVALAAGQSVTFWQRNLNALGEPRVEARVTAVNSTAVTNGPYAKFDLAWGTGVCK